MSERYQKLFALPENLYAVGSPVVIAAGALLKDTQTGKVLAQLKLRNIGKKTIKAATVSVKPLDTVGSPLGESVTYQYLDLHADRDADFGQKTPIALPDSATRSLAVSVVQVIFTDNSIWNTDSGEWKPLSRPKPLDAMGDGELAKQFRIEYGGGCENLLLEQKDLWHCVCEAVNHQEETNCHRCHKVLAELQVIDMEDLRKKKEERVAKEKVEAEVARKNAEIARKKFAKNCAITAAILSTVVITAVFLIQVIIPTFKYESAISCMEKGNYEKAIEKFESLGAYKDSTLRIEECEIAILDQQYNTALALKDAGKYEEAIAAFEAITGYKDSAVQSEACSTAILDAQYNVAVALMNEEKYEEAVAAFEALNGYKDSDEKARSCYSRYGNTRLKDVQVGEYIYFGLYEQDNDLSNGTEQIEWLVVERTRNKLMVISKYALDCKPYNTKDEAVTWENCSLRRWLNEDFLKSAFSKEEQAIISATTVSADENPCGSVDPGNTTTDKVFLPSVIEIIHGFSLDEKQDDKPTGYEIVYGMYLTQGVSIDSLWQCEPTNYAISNGAYIDGNRTCYWRLRSPGTKSSNVARINPDGSIGLQGDNVAYNAIAVRPALWIDLGN